MSKKMGADTNALNWFEIPATDITRATTFYENIFEIKMHQMEMMGMKMAMFPPDGSAGTVGGGIAQSDMHKPVSGGTIVYLNANPDLQTVLDRVEKSGGKVAMPKTKISDDIGFMAFFTDTEGNYIGLHSGK